jgi:hypothetical protein
MAVVVASALHAATGAAPAHARYCAPGDRVGSGFYTALKAANGRWVSAEHGRTGWRRGMLRARAGVIGAWEGFYVRCLGDRRVALRASNGRWVSAEVGMTGWRYGMLRARASEIGAWEKFRYYPVDGSSFVGGRIVLSSYANGLSVSAELGYNGLYDGMLRARDRLYGRHSGPWEEFRATPL